MSKDDFEKPEVISKYDEAQGVYGDRWRLKLINPLVTKICAELASPNIGKGLDFSVYEAFAAEVAPQSSSWDSLRVLDLGCGQGCLGRLVEQYGATYLGLDASEGLLNTARKRSDVLPGTASDAWRGRGDVGSCAFERADLNTNSSAVIESVIRPHLRRFGHPQLATMIVVLDHLPQPTGVLQWLGLYLNEAEATTTILFVTLDPDYLLLSSIDRQEPGPDGTIEVTVMIESAGAQVRAWSRPHRVYENLFRDAGLHVRRCEPLHFCHNELASPSKELPSRNSNYKPDVARLPTFWAWRLSARRRKEDLSDQDYECCHTVLGDVDRKAIRLYSVPNGNRIFAANNLGGELCIVLHGRAETMTGALKFVEGSIIGELEAGGGKRPETYFPFDVVAATGDCRVALVSASETTRILDQQSSTVSTRAFHQLRWHLRQVNWRVESKPKGGQLKRKKGKKDNKRKVSVGWIYAVVKALLWAKELEDQYRQPLGARTVFITPEEVRTLFLPAAKSGQNEACQLLQELRFIDTFPGYTWQNALRRHNADLKTIENMTREFWSRIQKRAASEFLPELDTQARDTLISVVSTELDFETINS
jgi:hypothetical protein